MARAHFGIAGHIGRRRAFQAEPVASEAVRHAPRFPADPNKTDDENQNTQANFVANGARAVRTLVGRLEEPFPWFRQPEDTKASGSQHHFARLYDALRIVTTNS